jgi:HAD superfamily hydrolase (TIGR01509 family)
VNVRHLVVDLGGVLFHFDHSHRLDLLSRASGLPPDQIHALLWESGFSADCDEGRYGSAAEVRAHIRAAVGLAGSDDELDEVWCSAYRPDETVLETLDRRREGIALAVFTNNGPLEEEVLTGRYPAAFAASERLFFSHRLGCRKPDPAAFSAVAAHLGAEGGDILFVDDSPRNVAAARASGWRAVTFDSPEDLARALSANGTGPS